MLARIESRLRRLRHTLSRSTWLARLLRLPVSQGPPTRRGLVMIQVDGLSQPELERALERGEMPFLERLARREHYQLHAHYSGLPSTTPAVQAELFYGVKGAVPAFAFRSRELKRIIRMYEPEAASEVESEHLGDRGEPLLEGGSAYADSFTGGAEETHFCSSSMGWGSALRAANPFVVATFVLANLYSFLRVGVLALMEVGLAFVDLARGLVKGYDFVKELKFVPTRVGISILLRELCVIGGKIDVSRGLPIIHINFLGYDEQAHRRGPRSLFAHWTLKGIDDAIARLWRAAHRSPRRRYDVWIYSDHGQEEAHRFHDLHGCTLEEAVTADFDDLHAEPTDARPASVESIQTHRVRFLGGERVQRLFARFGMNGDESGEPRPAVAALGPVGHVYLPEGLQEGARELIARDLARERNVPVVIITREEGGLRALAGREEFRLPDDAEALFGADHPFIDALGEDLAALCGHPEAGDLVVLGWRKGVNPVTFAQENGSHAGASPRETNGFAFLPPDTPLGERDRAYLRPMDLRRAALAYLGRAGSGAGPRRWHPTGQASDTLRLMSYNVHSCIGTDGQLDVERIARVIARARPDVVALQELDVGRSRTGGMDQAHLIAEYLRMEFHFHPTMNIEEELYGDAVLTHLPMRLVKAAALPGLADLPNLEPRGAVWVAVDVGGRELNVFNTHLGLLRRERMAQVEALLGEEWLSHPDCRSPVVLLGDFNALPGSGVCRRLGTRMTDIQAGTRWGLAKHTFPSRFPTVRIDHVFVDDGLEVTGVDVPGFHLAGVASDHLPLIADVRINVPR